jgi:alkylation response protein AidB-like acyl-CoA dehydrogenase
LVGGGIALKVVHLFEQLCNHVRHTPYLRADALVRQRIGEMASQIEAARQMMVLCAQSLDKGNMDLADAAVSKVYSGELMERFSECALDILGMEGALSQNSAGSILNGRIEQNLRHSLMWVISIGTNEIQRNLIAQRALGLPRA